MWLLAHQEALEAIRASLANPPLLRLFDPSYLTRCWWTPLDWHVGCARAAGTRAVAPCGLIFPQIVAGGTTLYH